MLKLKKRIDAHIHYALPLEPETLIAFMDKTGTDMANLVLVPHPQRLSSVPEALMAKYKYPDRFYVFTSLDPSAYFRYPKTFGKHMASHVKKMLKCGCDGVKIIEGKPTMRKMMPIPDFDAPCWEPFWAYAEAEQVPILWHVNDPQEYWDASDATDYRKKMGDVYDDSFVNYEDQYQQIFHILQRHPNIKIIFAHFFFMSQQLERLGKLFDTYPNIMVDMTPGSEMYRHLSADHDNAQAFFRKYYKRILYGTDIAARCVMVQLMASFNEEENLRRVELINSFFTPETDTIMGSDGVYLLDVPDFRIRGLDLTEDELDHIFCKNFQNFVSVVPAKVDPKQVVKACKQLQITLKVMSLFDKTLKGDPTYAKNAAAFFQNK